MAFSLETRSRVLLWSDRHCCVCKKGCGVNIEVHHVVPESEGGDDDIDNAIPLCFDCHSGVQHYNVDHPKGTKFKTAELQARREQVYEEFTRHLVPPVHYELTQGLPDGHARRFPDVGFLLSHVGDSLPVRVRVEIGAESQGDVLTLPHGYYTGETLWHLNPRFTILGHFEVPRDFSRGRDRFTVQVRVSVIDQYGRPHKHLPVGYTYSVGGNSWYLEPWSRDA